MSLKKLLIILVLFFQSIAFAAPGELIIQKFFHHNSSIPASGYKFVVNITSNGPVWAYNKTTHKVYYVEDGWSWNNNDNPQSSVSFDAPDLQSDNLPIIPWGSYTLTVKVYDNFGLYVCHVSRGINLKDENWAGSSAYGDTFLNIKETINNNIVSYSAIWAAGTVESTSSNIWDIWNNSSRVTTHLNSSQDPLPIIVSISGPSTQYYKEGSDYTANVSLDNSSTGISSKYGFTSQGSYTYYWERYNGSFWVYHSNYKTMSYEIGVAAEGSTHPIKITVTDSNGAEAVETKTIYYYHNVLPKNQFGLVDGIPLEYLLSQNYPNPFNPTTIISYQMPEAGFVTLKIYDMLGKEVANLVNGKNEAGKYNVEFKASNLASGIYVYSITVQSFEGSQTNFTKSAKMLLLK